MDQHGAMFLLLLICSSSGYGIPTSSQDSSSATNTITEYSDEIITSSENINSPPFLFDTRSTSTTSDNQSSTASTCAPSCEKNLTQNAVLCSKCRRKTTTDPPSTVTQNEFDSMKLCLAMILLLLALTSSGFLVAYLRTSFKKKGSKTLLLKITCSYCFTLLLLYIASAISFILFNFLHIVRAAETITQYFIYSLFLWSCIITYECWQCFIRFKDYKVDSNQSKRRRHMEYSIRCCLAWITPILIPVNSFFCPQVQYMNQNNIALLQSKPLTNESSLRCPRINHTINDQLLGCANFVVSQHSSSSINLIFTVVLAMLIILSFVHICVRFRALLVEVGDADMNSSKKKRRYRFMVYAKLLCVTGTFWVVSSFLIFLDEIFPSIGIIVCFLVTAYGILLCISLGKKNHSIYNILRGHMNRDFIRRFPDGVSMSQVRITR